MIFDAAAEVFMEAGLGAIVLIGKITQINTTSCVRDELNNLRENK